MKLQDITALVTAEGVTLSDLTSYTRSNRGFMARKVIRALHKVVCLLSDKDFARLLGENKERVINYELGKAVHRGMKRCKIIVDNDDTSITVGQTLQVLACTIVVDEMLLKPQSPA